MGSEVQRVRRGRVLWFTMGHFLLLWGSCVGSLVSSATVLRGGHFKRADSWELTRLGPLCEGTNDGLVG